MKYIKTFENTIFLNINDKLIDAIYFDNKVIKVKKLIESGADINYIDTSNDNMTPLMVSIVRNRIEITKYLIENGADTNSQDVDGKTPLMYAGSMNSFEMVQLLIEAGVDWNIKDDNGDDFFELLDDEMIKDVIENYPDEYKDYLMKKEAEKYNL